MESSGEVKRREDAAYAVDIHPNAVDGGSHLLLCLGECHDMLPELVAFGGVISLEFPKEPHKDHGEVVEGHVGWIFLNLIEVSAAPIMPWINLWLVVA